jgi:hypothetical protein
MRLFENSEKKRGYGTASYILCKGLAWASQRNLSQVDTRKLELMHENLLWLEFCKEIADRVGIHAKDMAKKPSKHQLRRSVPCIVSSESAPSAGPG